jgi:hypothetical protein
MCLPRCRCNVVLTSKHLLRKWVSVRVPKCAVYVQKQVCLFIVFGFRIFNQINRYVRASGAAAACYAGRLRVCYCEGPQKEPGG